MTALRPVPGSRWEGNWECGLESRDLSIWEAQVDILGLSSAMSKLRTKQRLADAYSTLLTTRSESTRYPLLSYNRKIGYSSNIVAYYLATLCGMYKCS